MVRWRDPSWVSGKPGRIVIQPPIVHPQRCVCRRCATLPIEERAKPREVRIKRTSPFPDSRHKSAVYARQVKQELEAELLRDRDASASTRQNATFKQCCDAYRQRMASGGKRIDKDEYTIRALESHFGSDRDPAAIGKRDYQTWCESLTGNGVSAATIQRRTNVLLAILNSAVTDDLIAGHKLKTVRRPAAARRSKPVTFTRRQVAVLLGPAMDRFEAEQRQTMAEFRPGSQPAPPSAVPLRGYCLIAYYTLMRPDNNLRLRWDQIEIDERAVTGRFRLNEHKNSAKGIEVDAALHPELVKYLLTVPRRGSWVHVNPQTGQPYANIRRKWGRLVEIANEILAAENAELLTGRKRQFYVWRHTGASSLAEIASPVLVGRLMGDTSLKTIMDHYFDTSLEQFSETMAVWRRPDGEAGTRTQHGPGYVFFIASDDLVAVGWARNVAERLDQMQQASPSRLTLLGAVRGDLATKKTIHARLKVWRRHGEWFELAPESEAVLEGLLGGPLLRVQLRVDDEGKDAPEQPSN